MRPVHSGVHRGRCGIPGWRGFGQFLGPADGICSALVVVEQLLFRHARRADGAELPDSSSGFERCGLNRPRPTRPSRRQSELPAAPWRHPLRCRTPKGRDPRHRRRPTRGRAASPARPLPGDPPAALRCLAGGPFRRAASPRHRGCAADQSPTPAAGPSAQVRPAPGTRAVRGFHVMGPCRTEVACVRVRNVRVRNVHVTGRCRTETTWVRVPKPTETLEMVAFGSRRQPRGARLPRHGRV